MKRTKVVIELLSYWHAGSGEGRGGDVDALVIRDKDGLPYLPGKTIKGLFREGIQICEDAGEISPKTTERLFGKHADKGSNTGSKPGLLYFQDARMEKSYRDWLATGNQEKYRNELFDTFSSTKIDKDGLAIDKTLRSIEVCVPITLETTVNGPDEDNWEDTLKRGATFIRSLGSHRHRGLGRCHIVVQNQEEVI